MEQSIFKTKKIFDKSKIPNYLTIIRILFIPIILIFLFIQFGNVIYTFIWFNNKTEITLNFLLAGIFFIFSSFTDFLDGFLARKYNWESDFGKIWDPIADKLLINSCFISFSILGYVPWYLTIIMCSRDIIIDAYRMFVSNKQIIIKANFLGKLKTVLQMLSIIVIFFIFNSKDSINSRNIEYLFIQNIFTFIATIFSIISGIYYIFSIQKKLSNNKQ